MKKSERKARKRQRHHKVARKVVTCDWCGAIQPDDTGNHDSAWSVNGITWDGVAVVAFCQWCGSDTCH